MTLSLICTSKTSRHIERVWKLPATSLTKEMCIKSLYSCSHVVSFECDIPCKGIRYKLMVAQTLHPPCYIPIIGSFAETKNLGYAKNNVYDCPLSNPINWNSCFCLKIFSFFTVFNLKNIFLNGGFGWKNDNVNQ